MSQPRLGARWGIKLLRTARRNKSTIMPTSAHLTCDEFAEQRSVPLVKDYSEVPGPRALPLLGNTWRFIPYIGPYKISEINKISKNLYREYGEVAKIEKLLGRPDMVFLYDPNEIEKVFRSEDALPFRPSMPSLDYYKHVLRKDFFSDIGGVIATHGEKWHTFRSRVQQSMLQPRVAKMYIGPIEETGDEFVKRIAEIRDASNTVPADFLNEIHKWSLESIAKVALDIKLGCLSNPSAESQELIDSINTFFKSVVVLELKVPFWKLFNTSTWKKFIASLDSIVRISMKHTDAALDRLTKEGGSNSAEPSLLERVLAQNPDNPRIATILALDMFLVGVDTTSGAIASILYQLSKHQEAQQRLFTEVESVLKGQSLSSTSFEKMPYLKACIRETLRMYPVVLGNGRCLTKDTEICGYNIPKGTQIVFQHYAISNSNMFFEDAEKFKPERWLQKTCCHPFASLPFGFGRRMCLGRRFADLELQTLIAKIILNYNVQYNFGELEYKVQPMFMPSGPLKFTFLDRQLSG